MNGPLTEVLPGEPVRVVAIDAAPAAMRRLTELGLVPGLVVTVVNAAGGGLIVAARDARIALGRTLADAVTVATTRDAP